MRATGIGQRDNNACARDPRIRATRAYERPAHASDPVIGPTPQSHNRPDGRPGSAAREPLRGRNRRVGRRNRRDPDAEGDVLDPLVQAQCSLAVQVRRASGSIIGREAELTAFAQEIRAAADHLTAVTLEGEPGIGKTRLLLEACDLASKAGFTRDRRHGRRGDPRPVPRRAQPLRGARDPGHGGRDAG